MTAPGTPLRLLAKTYANDLISREQYIEIRAQLLKRLEANGKITESDLRNFTALT
jgi:phage portal protein BeeE